MKLRTKSFLFKLMASGEVDRDHPHPLQPRRETGSGLAHPSVFSAIPAFSASFPSSLENKISRVLVSNPKFLLQKDFLRHQKHNQKNKLFKLYFIEIKNVCSSKLLPVRQRRVLFPSPEQSILIGVLGGKCICIEQIWVLFSSDISQPIFPKFKQPKITPMEV